MPKPPTSLERKHRDRVGAMGCLVCGAPSTLHHVTAKSDRFGRYARSERRITPLCPMHHQAVHDPYASDPVSVERLNHRGFYDKHGVDLWGEAERLWSETEALYA